MYIFIFSDFYNIYIYLLVIKFNTVCDNDCYNFITINESKFFIVEFRAYIYLLEETTETNYLVILISAQLT